MTDSMRELKAELERQRRLVDASYALHSTLDVNELLTLLLQVASEGVDADRGTVFLLDHDLGELWSKVIAKEEALEIRLPLGQGIAGTVASTGETIRIAEAYDDPRFDRSWDDKSGFRTHQILCAPIRNRKDKIVGVFQLLNKRKGEFTSKDESYLASLSVSAALAIENAKLHASSLEKERYDREVLLAQNVQRQLQPERRLSRSGVIAAAGFNELCEDATGDYYDLLISPPDDRLIVAVGDVSGHGLQAALVMAEARAFLRAFVQTADNPAQAMGLLNDSLEPDLPDGKFVSLFLASVDTSTGKVQWSNAGHNPPFVRKSGSGEIVSLDRTGVALGFMPGMAYRSGEPFSMEPGDILLIYTDGITEARNSDNELFEENRLQECLARSAEGDPESILESIRRSVREWTGDEANEDDLTMLVVKHMGE